MATQESSVRGSNAAAWVMVLVMVVCGAFFVAFILPDISLAPAIQDPAIQDPAPAGRVGNQAPPSAVRRTSAQPVSRPAAPADAVQQSIDEYNAAQNQQFDAAVNAAPVAQPLPLNSAGEPVIDEVQQAQMAQSLSLAEKEGAAAVDAQLAAQREAANADALSRPPDVSKEEAEKMMGRDLCHVPRANPATCGQGLYKPTPVN